MRRGPKRIFAATSSFETAALLALFVEKADTNFPLGCSTNGPSRGGRDYPVSASLPDRIAARR